MLTCIVRMSKMNYLNIQNRSQCSFRCALEVHLTQKKSAIYTFDTLFSSGWYSGNTQNFCNIFLLLIRVTQRGSCIENMESQMQWKVHGRCLRLRASPISP